MIKKLFLAAMATAAMIGTAEAADRFYFRYKGFVYASGTPSPEVPDEPEEPEEDPIGPSDIMLYIYDNGDGSYLEAGGTLGVFVDIVNRHTSLPAVISLMYDFGNLGMKVQNMRYCFMAPDYSPIPATGIPAGKTAWCDPVQSSPVTQEWIDASGVAPGASGNHLVSVSLISLDGESMPSGTRKVSEYVNYDIPVPPVPPRYLKVAFDNGLELSCVLDRDLDEWDQGRADTYIGTSAYGYSDADEIGYIPGNWMFSLLNRDIYEYDVTLQIGSEGHLCETPATSNIDLSAESGYKDGLTVVSFTISETP